MEMEVNELCERFTLTELEQEELVATMNPLSTMVSKGNHCLVIELCTSRPFNKEAFKFTLRKIWQPAKSVWFHELGFDLTLAEFEDYFDKKMMIRESP